MFIPLTRNGTNPTMLVNFTPMVLTNLMEEPIARIEVSTPASPSI